MSNVNNAKVMISQKRRLENKWAKILSEIKVKNKLITSVMNDNKVTNKKRPLAPPLSPVNKDTIKKMEDYLNELNQFLLTIDV